MKIAKHNLIWIILLSSSFAFGQKQTKKLNENFNVNHDVLVEIDAEYTDIIIETWNKNIVDIQGVWELDGRTKEEAEESFKNWNFEALGNKEKVIITSKSSGNSYYAHSIVFDDMDFDFDDDSIHYVGEIFNGDFYSNMPPMPPLPTMSPMPILLPMPPFPAPFVGHLKKLEFDYEAYQKDKKGYLKDFEKRQQEWEKEYTENFEPQKKAYEKQMKEWEKNMQPQMKVYEAKMKQWEKDVAPQVKAYEKKLEKKLKKMEQEMEVKYVKKIKKRELKNDKQKAINKQIHIKVPPSATLKINAHYGKTTVPEGIKTIN